MRLALCAVVALAVGAPGTAAADPTPPPNPGTLGLRSEVGNPQTRTEPEPQCDPVAAGTPGDGPTPWGRWPRMTARWSHD